MSASQNPWVWSHESQDHYRTAVDAYGTFSKPSALFSRPNFVPIINQALTEHVPAQVDNKPYGTKKKGMRSDEAHARSAFHSRSSIMRRPCSCLISTPRQAPITSGPSYQTPLPYQYSQLQSPQTGTFGFPDASYTYDQSSRWLALMLVFPRLTMV